VLVVVLGIKWFGNAILAPRPTNTSVKGMANALWAGVHLVTKRLLHAFGVQGPNEQVEVFIAACSVGKWPLARTATNRALNGSGPAPAAEEDLAGGLGRSDRRRCVDVSSLIRSQYLRDANVSRIRWMMQVCTVAREKTVVTLSGKLLSPSQTRKNTSVTSRFFRSVSKAGPNFADSPTPVPGPDPVDVFLWPSRSTEIAAF
jgi:hypothetical protein